MTTARPRLPWSSACYSRSAHTRTSPSASISTWTTFGRQQTVQCEGGSFFVGKRGPFVQHRVGEQRRPFEFGLDEILRARTLIGHAMRPAQRLGLVRASSITSSSRRGGAGVSDCRTDITRQGETPLYRARRPSSYKPRRGVSIRASARSDATPGAERNAQRDRPRSPTRARRRPSWSR